MTSLRLRNGPAAPRPEGRASFGFREVDAAEKQALVDAVFGRVAARYDLMNDLMSGGLHRLWKNDLVAWLGPPARGTRPYPVLDVAGGTGDVAFRIARISPAAAVTVCDISPEMLAVGRQRAADAGLQSRIAFVEGNAEVLPFPAGRFEAVTCAFGIRNITDIPTALSEAFRVLRPGGRLLILEFSAVDVAWLDRLYDVYSFAVIPELGRLVAGDAESYRYLVESIRRFPNPERFAAMLGRAGFARVRYRPLAGGIVAIHSGWKL